MTTTSIPLHLPNYHTFLESIAVLALPFSGSELHGVMCGYLCAGATSEGDAYLRALMTHQRDADLRLAALALFGVYAISQQHISSFDFEFQLLLPEDDDPLASRAQALSEWCDGFIQGLTLAGVSHEELREEESREALEHLTEFAQMDYQGLRIDEEDEHALMEVSEYARMAVLDIYSDLQASHLKDAPSETAH